MTNVVLRPFLCLLPVLTACAGAVPRKSAAPLPVRAWWSMSSTAVGDLARAPDYGVNTLIVQHNTEVTCWAALDALAFYDFSDRFRRPPGPGRARAERLRALYGDLDDAARRAGVEWHLFGNEICVPADFGPLSYDDPALWTLIAGRLREVFRALPGARGYLLYFCEGPKEVVDLPGSETSMTRRYRKLIDTVWDVCRAERRKLFVTTFIHRLDKLEAIAEALRKIPPHPDFAVLQYCCPNDWGLYALLNPSIGGVGPHPEILGFDYAAENWGCGAHPFVHVDYMADRLRDARARSPNIAGLIGYVSWHERPSVFDTFNDANVRAGAVLARDPDRDGPSILREWCARRFGAAGADTAAACLARTHAAVFKAQHVFDYWLDTGTKSGLPSLDELDAYFIGDYWGEALGKWDPARADVWAKIQAPDEAFLAAVLAEKEEAVALCQRSLDEVHAARAAFRPADADALERAFAFQSLWAGLWRDLTHAFFLRRLAQAGGWTPDLRERLGQALQSLWTGAAELERSLGRHGFPPGPDRARDFVRAVAAEAGLPPPP